MSTEVWRLLRGMSDFPSSLGVVRLSVERLLLKEVYRAIPLDSDSSDVELLVDYWSSHRERPTLLYKGVVNLSVVVHVSPDGIGHELEWSLEIDGGGVGLNCLPFLCFYETVNIRVDRSYLGSRHRLGDLSGFWELLTDTIESVCVEGQSISVEGVPYHTSLGREPVGELLSALSKGEDCSLYIVDTDFYPRIEFYEEADTCGVSFKACLGVAQVSGDLMYERLEV
jgi:hypothetical protein